jgi:voltage-gated potassium channel
MYRVELPEPFVGHSIDEVSAMLRRDHGATLLAVTREHHTFSNLPSDFTFESGDDLVVVAESLGDLSPLSHSSALSETRS